MTDYAKYVVDNNKHFDIFHFRYSKILNKLIGENIDVDEDDKEILIFNRKTSNVVKFILIDYCQNLGNGVYKSEFKYIPVTEFNDKRSPRLTVEINNVEQYNNKE